MNKNNKKNKTILPRKMINTMNDILALGTIKRNVKKKTNQNKRIEAIFGNPSLTVMNPGSNSVGKKSRIALSPCALKFALAVSDPFDPAARGACIPISASPTQKVHSFIRFDAVVGTAGVGWVLISPSTANDINSILYTTSTYAGTVAVPVSANNVFFTGVTGAGHNGPYNAASLTSNNGNISYVNGRVVSAAVRLQYTGTTLNESGLFYCLQDPDHASLSGCGTADISRFETTEIHSVSRDPCMIVVFPNDENEAQIHQNSGTDTLGLFPFSRGVIGFNTSLNGTSSFTSGLTGAPPALIMFTGVPGQTFHGEYITHLEYNGPGASALTSPVDSDAAATFQVITAAKTITEKKLDRPKLSNWSAMYEALGEMAAKSMPVLVPAAQAAVAALV